MSNHEIHEINRRIGELEDVIYQIRDDMRQCAHGRDLTSVSEAVSDLERRIGNLEDDVSRLS